MDIIPGQAILLHLPWDNSTPLHVLAIYAPNNLSDNATFFRDLQAAWQTNMHPLIDILLGDFNIIEDTTD